MPGPLTFSTELFAIDSVIDQQGPVFFLISAKYPVPDVEQMTEICFDVERIACMMHPVVGRGQHNLAQQSESGIGELLVSESLPALSCKVKAGG